MPLALQQWIHRIQTILLGILYREYQWIWLFLVEIWNDFSSLQTLIRLDLQHLL